MDLRMPGMDGIEATRRITADPALAHVAVVALTTFDSDELVFEALRAGASGFLPQGRRARRAAPGGPRRRRRRRRALAGRDAPRDDGCHGVPACRRHPLRRLTDREQEVLVAVGQGLSNDEIARALHMSPATARTHVGRILVKTGARDRAQLVVLAWRAGVVT
jgi:DNA-binding NarL/FixJ family response regulator